LSGGASVPTIRSWSFSGRSCVLPRWRARASRSDEGLVGGSFVEVYGSIRNPDETDALSVELTIADTEITLRADGNELGRWPASAVSIQRIDSTGFELIAEGDRLIFTPVDPAAFGEIPIIAGHRAGAGKRMGRKSKRKMKQSDDAEPKLAWYQDFPGEERRPPQRAAQESPQESSRNTPRRRHKTPVESAVAEDDNPGAEPAPPSTGAGPVDATLEAKQPQADMASSNGRRRRKPGRSAPAKDRETDGARSKEPTKRSTVVWLRALDVARKYDAFGLDRVPIDTSLRGREHQHTWDHRVAASSGLGKHICTICGAIRR